MKQIIVINTETEYEDDLQILYTGIILNLKTGEEVKYLNGKLLSKNKVEIHNYME